MADTADLLRWARATWGSPRMSVTDVVTAHGVVHGDLCRLARTVAEGGPLDVEGLEREFGNLVLSGLRWADELGLDPDACIERAKAAQERYAEERRG